MEDSIDGLDEAALAVRAREGDTRAAARLLEDIRPELVRFCYRYLGNIDEAEDATQDVLAAMIDREWPRGEHRPYMLRAARNRCLELSGRRRDGRVGVGSFLGDSGLPSPRTGPKTAMARKDEHEILKRHLGALSREQAEVITLRYFEGLSRRDIAEVLGLQKSVVKSRLHEALRALDRIVKEFTR